MPSKIDVGLGVAGGMLAASIFMWFSFESRERPIYKSRNQAIEQRDIWKDTAIQSIRESSVAFRDGYDAGYRHAADSVLVVLSRSSSP